MATAIGSSAGESATFLHRHNHRFKQSYKHPSELQKELCKQLCTAILIWSHDIEELCKELQKGVQRAALQEPSECEKELDQEPSLIAFKRAASGA